MSTYLKHVEIIKLEATNICDISFDSALKTKFTLKILALYLLIIFEKLNLFVQIYDYLYYYLQLNKYLSIQVFEYM